MKKEERIKIVSKIKYELADGDHTFTMCYCDRNGRRAKKCWECLLEDLI